MCSGVAVFQAAVGNHGGAAVDIQLVTALGVGVQGHLRAALGGDGKHVPAGKFHVAVGVNGVVAGGVAIDIAAGNVHLALAVDSVIGRGIGVQAAAGNGELAFGLHAFALGGSGHDAAAAYHQVTAVHIVAAAAFLEANLDGFGGDVVGLAAGSGDGEGAAGDITVGQAAVGFVVAIVAGPDAFAAGAGIGDGHRAAGHAKAVVGLDAGCAIILAVFAVVGHAAANGNGGGAAFHQDIIVAGDTLFHGGFGGDVQGAVGEPDVVVGLDAVTGARAGRYGDVGAGEQAHVIVRGNAAFPLGIIGRYGELVGAAGRAAEDELALGEEDGFHVFVAAGGVAGAGTIGQGVGAFNIDKGTFAALVVNGGAVGVGEGEAAQPEGLLFLAVQLETAVGRAAAELVNHILRAGVGEGYPGAVGLYVQFVCKGLVPAYGGAAAIVGDAHQVREIVLGKGVVLVVFHLGRGDLAAGGAFVVGVVLVAGCVVLNLLFVAAANHQHGQQQAH